MFNSIYKTFLWSFRRYEDIYAGKSIGGYLQCRYEVKDNKKNGLYREYDNFGNELVVGQYEDDKKDGIWTINGNIPPYNRNNGTYVQQRIEYKKGLRDGLYEEYDNDLHWLTTKGQHRRNLKHGTWITGCTETPYQHGEIHGTVIERDENENIIHETKYKKGKQHGEEKQWSNDGTLVEHYIYNNGKLKSILKSEIFREPTEWERNYMKQVNKIRERNLLSYIFNN